MSEPASTPIPPTPRWAAALGRLRTRGWVVIAINAAALVYVVYAFAAGGQARGYCDVTNNCTGKRGLPEMVGPWWILFVILVVDVVIGIIWWFGRAHRSQ